MAYGGHIVLSGSSGATVKVTLVWGSQPDQQQSVTLPRVGPAYRTLPFRLASQADTEDGRLQITGTGSGTYRVGTVSLMPANNIEGFRAEVIAALRQLHSCADRFPGGIRLRI